ncbi:dTDP-4-dehydrorhamnose 3,5-epimerase [Thomasclavelia sp.]|uniref:dTDP-4-dehydrorhamnose 3,5-epimerase n=1 Tax=Thomasclavelia sp. TaxID=3025757 RepID=UPI0025F37CC5|nr:dTDP-4-dehydrorhamnose 3,5-epimerase [Thomasclavelia sp.]
MSFKFHKTPFEGVYAIENHVFEDDRGIYSKNYEIDIFKKHGINFSITESSDLYTKKGAIRGLHYQKGESQAKLVRVIKGKIFDVIVDLRMSSPSYMQVYSIILDEKNINSLLIPKDFAHGFLALEDSIFSYHCDGEYQPELCGGIRWNDPKLDILWPIKEYNIEKLIITNKDSKWDLL